MKVAVNGCGWGRTQKVKVKVKVSGGVRTLEACQEWVQRGSGRT
jgi:deoxyribose-phosphate aldolase